MVVVGVLNVEANVGASAPIGARWTVIWDVKLLVLKVARVRAKIHVKVYARDVAVLVAMDVQDVVDVQVLVLAARPVAVVPISVLVAAVVLVIQDVATGVNCPVCHRVAVLALKLVQHNRHHQF